MFSFKTIEYYKKKNPDAYCMIYKKLEEIMENPSDVSYKKVKNILGINVLEKESIEYALKF